MPKTFNGVKWLCVIAGMCALAPMSASAQVIITEIMYDLAEGSDSGREWMEVFNAGSVPVRLAEWRVFENGTNHKIAGGGPLAPGAYAIIVDNAEKFKTDWPAFAGLVFDSAFSLSNDGESLALRDIQGVEGDSAAFSSGLGGDGTGDSLQRSGAGASFAAGVPTPGSGIPAGGLQKTPQKVKVSGTKKSATATLVETNITGKTESEPQVAGAAVMIPTAPREVSYLWWFAPVILASAGSAGLVASRHFRKDEWDIIEESDEAR